jgi:hypothetical protein
MQYTQGHQGIQLWSAGDVSVRHKLRKTVMSVRHVRGCMLDLTNHEVLEDQTLTDVCRALRRLYRCSLNRVVTCLLPTGGNLVLVVPW